MQPMFIDSTEQHRYWEAVSFDKGREMIGKNLTEKSDKHTVKFYLQLGYKTTHKPKHEN